MLAPHPKHPVTDFHPDIDAIDLWHQQFSWSTIPISSAVYAFYYADTGEIAYIGSACGRGFGAAVCGGLRFRLASYRRTRLGSRANVERKIQLANASRKLLLRAWLCGSEGDCRKYESDSIEVLRPPLNKAGAKVITADDGRAHERHRHFKLRSSWQQRGFDPNMLKVCTCCHVEKRNTEFPRGSTSKSLTRSKCKACTRRSVKRCTTYDPTVLRPCTICKAVKPCAEFPRNSRRVLGVGQQCKLCRNSRRNALRRMTKRQQRHGVLPAPQVTQ